MNFWNLWVHHGCRGEHREGLAVVERMLAHPGARGERVLRLVACFAASMAHFWVGDYARAERFEGTVLGLYDFDSDRDLVWQYNHDPKNTLMSWGSQRLWALGFPDRARRMSDEAVAHARAVGHPFNLCWTLGNSSFVYANCGGFEVAEARLDEIGEIAEREGLEFIDGYMVPANRCLLAMQQGRFELAYRESARAEALWGSIGGRFWSPIVRACMALSAAELGRAEEAVDIIGRAIGQVETTGERMYAEEIYRIAGGIFMQTGCHDTAFEHYERSLGYARQHGTRSFELRTAMNVALLWEGKNRRTEARALVTSAYAAFDEGYGTSDLRAARELLGEPSTGPTG